MVTLTVLTVNVADVAPCGIVTVAGTLAALVLEELSETTAPPLPAAADKVTVPVPVWPLAIVLGLTDTLLNAAGGGVMLKLDEVTLAPE